MSILYTERLKLRPFQEGDAPAMFRNWMSDEEVARFCRWYRHRELKSTQWMLDMYLREAQDGFEYRWAVTERDSDEAIGAVEVVSMRKQDHCAEIGYVIARRFWNRGFMTEAVRAVIEELFRSGFAMVCGRRHEDNPASGRVMEKCGMRYVGKEKEIRKYSESELCEMMVYEITAQCLRSPYRSRSHSVAPSNTSRS